MQPDRIHPFWLTLAGCMYNRQKYLNGEEVRTDQPCLRCVCKKGVLLCALRVCPPVSPGNRTSATSKCQVIREPSTCCPTLQCVDAHQHGILQPRGDTRSILTLLHYLLDPHHAEINDGFHVHDTSALNVKGVSGANLPLISINSSTFETNFPKGAK